MSNFKKIIDRLDAYAQQARDKIIENKRKELKSGDLFDDRTDEEIEALILSDDEAKFRIESESIFRSMLAGLNNVGAMGQMMLLAMWRARRDKMYMAMNESESVSDALHELAGDNIDQQYMKAMLQVVEVFYKPEHTNRNKESIFEYVHRREKSGNPVKDEKGRIITLEEEDDEFHVNLISSPGLISKLKENAYHFSWNTDSDEEKEQILAAIGSGKSREFVKAVKEKQKRESAPVQIKVVEKEGENGKMNIEFKTTKFEIDAKDWKAIKKKLGEILEIQL